FLQLNERAGGFGQDGEPIQERSVGDVVGIRNAYASGLSNSGGGGLATIPIVTWRFYWDDAAPGRTSAIHDRLQDFILRARMERATGTTANQVLLTQGAEGRVNFPAISLDLATRWLDALASDPAPASAGKVARLRPADARDACWDKS